LVRSKVSLVVANVERGGGAANNLVVLLALATGRVGVGVHGRQRRRVVRRSH